MEVEIKATHSGLEVAEQLLLDSREMGRLMRLADLQFGIGRDDAQDLLQETALDIVREKKGIKNPHGYVTRVFYMQCCQFVRRAVRRRAHEGRPRAFDVAAPGAVDADELLALEEALERISPGCRGLLIAHYMEGKSFGEPRPSSASARSRPGSGSTRVSGSCGCASKERNENGSEETYRRSDSASPRRARSR